MISVENLDVSALLRAFRRLKKATGHFERLLVRDPTDFVDFQIQLSRQFQALDADLQSGRYVPQKPILHPYPKSKGINRPTVVFDVRDALVYRFCIEQIDNELIEMTRRNSNIRGGVKISPNLDPAADGYYEKYFKDWTDHNAAIREGLTERPVAATTDIASYFEGIDVPLLLDLVRSAVSGKAGVVNLLGFFLRGTKVEYEYGLTTNTGIPQEDIDCSRTLAYFYLHTHDDRLVQFTLAHHGELFRYADDITILVETEAVARRALKAVTESLRELGLVASIEKTEIMTSDVVNEQLMHYENSLLDELSAPIEQAARANETPEEAVGSLADLYGRWKRGPEAKKQNWRKVLKRIYTLATLGRAPFLLDDLEEHLVHCPAEVHDKLTKYLLRIQQEVEISQVVGRLVQYLESEENLYPSLETNLIEALLYLDSSLFSETVCRRLGEYGWRILSGDQPALSQYARGLGALLCFRFRPTVLDKIADYYLRTAVGSEIFQKYLVFVGLTTTDPARRERVARKARAAQDASLSRLMSFVDDLPGAARNRALRSYFDRRRVYFLGADVNEGYEPVRHDVLKEIIRLNGSDQPTSAR